MQTLKLDSNKSRIAIYDESARTLTLDFAKGDAPPKLYRYVDVPESIFDEVKRRHETRSHPAPLLRESVGIYLGEAVTGGFKDAEIPFAWEKLDSEGNVVERSSKPVITRAA